MSGLLILRCLLFAANHNLSLRQIVAGYGIKFDYESDILYGISSISAKINDREGAQYIILGINRLVVFNKKMFDKIYSSGNTIDAFSTIVREIQYLDCLLYTSRCV